MRYIKLRLTYLLSKFVSSHKVKTNALVATTIRYSTALRLVYVTAYYPFWATALRHKCQRHCW